MTLRTIKAENLAGVHTHTHTHTHTNSLDKSNNKKNINKKKGNINLFGRYNDTG